jgi:GntR family transcriptional regulator
MTGMPGQGAGLGDYDRSSIVSDDVRATRGVPLYVQLRELIRESIRLGQWAPDEPLPTEAELQKQHGLSRSTVRQALSDLAHEGLLVRYPGRGTFAAQPSMVLGMRGLLSFRADLLARGIRPRRHLLNVERTVIPAHARRFVAELADQAVIHVHEVRYADDKPVVVFDNYFPYGVFSFMLEERSALEDPNGSLRDLAVSRGATFARAAGEVAATLTTAHEAELLELTPESPVVEILTKTFDLSEDVVEYSRAIIRTDRYALVLMSDWPS